ncbi:hypothetical protein ACSQU8_005864, partial [Pseudomonas aeruginosa]
SIALFVGFTSFFNFLFTTFLPLPSRRAAYANPQVLLRSADHYDDPLSTFAHTNLPHAIRVPCVLSDAPISHELS